jgi:potassium-transporting ATPase potassium-binding subunit
MSFANWMELVVLLVLLAISTPLLGNYMAKVYGGGSAPGDRFFLPIERLIYRSCHIDPEGEQRWTGYAMSLLVFGLVGCLSTYAIFRLQGSLPLNPDHLAGAPPGLSFSESIAFVTNTDWQSYVPESTMGIFAQLIGISVQFFFSAAVGMAVAIAFIRGVKRTRKTTIGNFWVDLVRSITRILVPISFVFAFVFLSQGVIQNFDSTSTVKTPAVQSIDAQGKPVLVQQVPGGPVASWMPAEALGLNGGGYYNANAGHPLENPNPITNIAILWLLAMIPFAFPWTFGKMIGSLRQGAVVLVSMAVLFVAPVVLTVAIEGAGNPQLPHTVSQAATGQHAGGNLEGKDLRLGTAGSGIDAASVTGTAAGMTNSAQESYVPLAGSLPLFNMMLGEVTPGGIGSGLWGKLILVLVTVFLAGLMVGRTPEYLGKKIRAHDVKLAAIYILVMPFVVLPLAAASMVMDTPLKSVWAPGAHGLTEVVYAFTSVAHNNGSGFAGISANTQWFNTTFGVAMLIGRYMLIIAALAIAGSLVRKRAVPMSAGTLRTDTPLFTAMLVAVTVIVTGLTYFPALALGPLAEHFSGHF